MARMIPSEPPNETGHHAERTVFFALQQQLDDDYAVFHSYLVVRPDKEIEREIDFLVVHRTLGLLVVECKGRGWVHAGGTWHAPHGGHRNPVYQVQSAAKALRDVLEKHLRLPRLPFACGYALVFPTGVVNRSSIGPALDSSLLWDAEDMDRLDACVRTAMTHWNNKRKSHGPVWSETKYQQFLSSLLPQALSVTFGRDSDLRSEERLVHQLSRQQTAVLDQVWHNQRFGVTGGAGTGKTVLARELATRLAGVSKRVLILVYNEWLADYLRGRLEPQWRGAITVATFHELCAEAARRRVKKVPSPPADPKAATDYWVHELPSFLEEAVCDDDHPRYDAVIVDEGQDFHSTWWETVEMLVAPQGWFVVFYDADQRIFPHGSGLPDLGFTLRLTTNYRNAQHICHALAGLTRNPLSPLPQMPEGEPPTCVSAAPGPAVKQAVETIVAALRERHDLRPQDLVILTPHRPEHSSLAQTTHLAGLRVTTDPSQRDRAVLLTTIGKFKGLEANAVIVADVDNEDPRCNQAARYVAASRARLRLYVVGDEEWNAPDPPT